MLLSAPPGIWEISPKKRSLGPFQCHNFSRLKWNQNLSIFKSSNKIIQKPLSLWISVPPSQRLCQTYGEFGAYRRLPKKGVEVRPSWRFTHRFYPGGGAENVWRFCSKKAKWYIIWIHQNMIRLWDISGTVTSWKRYVCRYLFHNMPKLKGILRNVHYWRFSFRCW